MILLLGVIVLLLIWNAIPDCWPVHWGLNDQPDRWAKKSVVGVFIPLAGGFLICGFLEAVAIIVRVTARERSELPIETTSAVAALTTDLVRTLETAIAIVFFYVGVAFPLVRHVRSIFAVVFMLSVVTAAIVIGIIRLRRGVSELKRAGHNSLEG